MIGFSLNVAIYSQKKLDYLRGRNSHFNNLGHGDFGTGD